MVNFMLDRISTPRTSDFLCNVGCRPFLLRDYFADETRLIYNIDIASQKIFVHFEHGCFVVCCVAHDTSDNSESANLMRSESSVASDDLKSYTNRAHSNGLDESMLFD